MKILGREPTLILQAISALLGLLVSFGFGWLSADQAGAIIAVVSGLIGAINAWFVRPVAPAAFTGLVTAGATLLATYGLDLSQEKIGLVQMAVVTVLTLLTRTQVSPAADVRKEVT